MEHSDYRCHLANMDGAMHGDGRDSCPMLYHPVYPHSVRKMWLPLGLRTICQLNSFVIFNETRDTHDRSLQFVIMWQPTKDAPSSEAADSVVTYAGYLAADL